MAYKALLENEEGYPLVYITDDGDVLCADCATVELNEGRQDPDALVGIVYWEGPMLSCQDCQAEIYSAYGVPLENT